MKKLDFFFFMVLLGAIGMVGCTQQSSVPEPSDLTSEIELAISKADMLKSSAVDEAWYCPDGFATEGSASISYEVLVYVTGQTEPLSKKDTLKNVSYTVNNSGVILQKITLNWKDFYPSADGDETVKVKITGVKVGDYNFVVPGFAAPQPDALYASYIPLASQIGQEWEVGLYQKLYIDVKVLCFNEQDIPEFGFSWFDFEIITGEEVCVYFNCLDNSSNHKNVPADYSAEFFTTDANGDDVWKTYWNDGIAGKTYALNCIPLPANYSEKGIIVKVDDIEVEVLPDDITAFLAEDTTYKRDIEGDGYDVIVDTDGHGAFFLHFVLDVCPL